jgi:superfamily II DNA or RNA helicase
MRLRNWQAECVTKTVSHFRDGNSNFLLVSPPGTGKSVTVAEIGACLYYEEKLIDLILCLSPSTEIRDGLYRTFNHRMPDVFHNGFGSIGESITYQRLLSLDESFLASAKNKRILVICDEIHHCSGGGDSIPNAWGNKMLSQILELATFTLCMSGTPWRTDQLPIALARYNQNELVVNYQYSLLKAVSDRVCRQPVICLIDNDDCFVDKKNYRSINDALLKTDLMYRQILENEPAVKHLLQLSISKLHEIRAHTPDAAGLVVAHSIEHAHRIKRLLEQTFKQTVQLVSYREKNPQSIIEQFRHGKAQWIVSIGMISEGTDIPRLHVCCHITTIRTELYFRQVLGRVLRVRAADNSSEGFLFTFAEPQLKRFACSIQNELPLFDVLRKSKLPPKSGSVGEEKSEPSSPKNNENDMLLEVGEKSPEAAGGRGPEDKSDFNWSFKGLFREEIIRALSQI